MGALFGGVLGVLFMLIPIAVSVFFIWVALRIVDELAEIREHLGKSKTGYPEPRRPIE